MHGPDSHITHQSCSWDCPSVFIFPWPYKVLVHPDQRRIKSLNLVYGGISMIFRYEPQMNRASVTGTLEGNLQGDQGRGCLEWRFVNFFCKGPHSKYLRLCGPDSLCCNYRALLLCVTHCHMQTNGHGAVPGKFYLQKLAAFHIWPVFASALI